MKYFKFLGLDFAMMIICIYLYEIQKSIYLLDSKSFAMSIFSFIVFTIILNLFSYLFSILIHFISKKKIDFVSALLIIKLILSLMIFYFFYLKSNYEGKLVDVTFLVLSLTSGVLLWFSIELIDKNRLFLVTKFKWLLEQIKL